MKAVATIELLLLAVLCGLAYMVWIQQAQLDDLQLRCDTLHNRVDALPKPRAARTPKSKETK